MFVLEGRRWPPSEEVPKPQGLGIGRHSVPSPLRTPLAVTDPLADPADRFFAGRGKFWRRGPNLPPLSTFSTGLFHFVLKLLNFNIFILCLFLY